MPRKNPVPTDAQRAASRSNGRLGGRPRNEWGVAESRRNAALARQLGMDQCLENLLFWKYVRDNGEAPVSAQMDAAAQIEDRYGKAKQSVTIAAQVETEEVKTVELVGGFEAPPGWNGREPGVRREDVVNALQPGAGNGNGNGNGKPV
jgi:hypothetical protein